jgi:Ca-activated chloride channel homolog
MKSVGLAFLLTVLFLALALGLPVPAAADGIIIPEPPPPPCRGCPQPVIPYLTVRNHHVEVTIRDQVATTRVDQVFVNESEWSLEGTYVFPLPEEAAISEFSMWVDGEKVEGQLYTREEARRIYESIVRRRLDPALLEYVGRDLFQASIFPIPAGDSRRVRIEYSQILAVDNGLVHYVYPLSTERFSARPLENVSVSVEIESNESIKAIYSPSHPVSIDRQGDFQALVGWEDRDVLPATDFSLFYTVSARDLGLNLLSYQQAGEDGFFVMLVAPNVEQTQVVDKDVILVLDTSGSMEGEKIEQARDALTFVLDHLNPGDRFNLVTFSTGVRLFSNRPEPLSALGEARRFVQNIQAEGSTDINRALLEALATADPDGRRPTVLIFLTDGLPTSGVVETPLILNNVDQVSGSSVRIFSFGVGDDVDTILLDTLARDNRGTSAYVRPGARVDEQVSAFYAKVSTPVLADIGLTVDGVRVDDTFPWPLPDLFAGTQLVLAGRYRQGGPATVTLEGQVNGRPQTFVYDDLTFARQGGRDFIPRLWATRKIGFLLNEVRLRGERPEVIDEIVKLSIRYGIITPYTSFLVEEPDDALTEEGRDVIIEREVERVAGAPAAIPFGAQAVDAAEAQADLEKAEIAAPLPTQGESASAASAANTVRVAGDKAFVWRDGIWTDTTFDPSRMSAQPLSVASPAFFELLLAHPEAGKYFALGERVIVVLEGQPYESTPPDPSLSQTPTGSGIEPAASPPAGPASPATTGRPSGSGPLHTTLSADVARGVAPLTVNFSGRLVGGTDNNPDYYCVESTFEFGNGDAQSQIPDCVEWTEEANIRREYLASYVYQTPGMYQARFSLGGTESELLTIVVGEAGTAAPPPQPGPSSVGNPSDAGPGLSIFWPAFGLGALAVLIVTGLIGAGIWLLRRVL